MKTTTQFCSKISFLVIFCQALPAHLVPCWWVSWWFRRAGCISQDTYLLYCTSFHETTYKGTNTCGCGLCRFMQICTNAVAFFRIIRILIYAVYADMCIMRMSFPNCIYVSTYTNIYKHLYFKTDFWVSYHHLT